MTYLAHISADGREQTVREHLDGTAELCRGFASSFGAEELGFLAGEMHDIGKFSAAFQRRLAGGPKVDHSTAGAFECCKARQVYAALAVMGHHGGMPDGGASTDYDDKGTFCARINKARHGALSDYSAWQDELKMPDAPQPMLDYRSGMFFTRMLYSCLVDADFLDTERFMSGGEITRGGYDDMASLCKRLDEYIGGWFPPKGELNEKRCAILNSCLNKGGETPRGLYTLTVPTGGGKTVASLAFALRHAKAQGMKHVIYVIPYTSIIEQTAAVFRDILGEENVLEHHSGVLFDLGDEADEKSVRLARSVENWDAPVIVTTAVQFFESLYSNKPSKCRKLHNIADSVIIFDEAQMLPLNYLRPCVFAMAQLVQNYKATAVLCTATQPALGKIFAEFGIKDKPRELAPDGTATDDIFRRVTFKKAGRLTYDELSERLNSENQVLCVCNKRKAAQEIFSRLRGEGCYHLSTLMYPKHRREVLSEIRERLKAGKPCRVVSTSLIEAGVDVDFPAVYREAAGLDSVLQAAGRCNREGRRKAGDSIVTVYKGEEAPPAIFDAAVKSGEAVMSRHEDIASPAAVTDYFMELYDIKGKSASDIKGIMNMMQSSTIPFETVAKNFKLIDSSTVTVYIPRGEGADIVSRLRDGERGRAIFRLAAQYGVSIYEQQFKSLDEAGYIERLDDEIFILSDPSIYSEQTGLPLTAEGGRAEFI